VIQANVVDQSGGLWANPVADLLSLLAEQSIAIHRVHTLDELPADAYFWIGTDAQALRNELANVGPEVRERTIVIGPPHGYQFGKPRPAAGTVAELLEDFRLGGAFASEALTAWSKAPSFAGPKVLMQAFGCNAVKAFQSRTYANWFSAPGVSMSAFLATYLPRLLELRISESRAPDET
jgi:hypothetical protein